MMEANAVVSRVRCIRRRVMASVAFLGVWTMLASTLAGGSELTRATVGSAEFRVEMAQTPQERERGLMFRQTLPAGQGMLFVQPPGRAAFWMKNTLIPLDLLYFDTQGQLVQIEAGIPPCVTVNCTVYPSKSTSVRYILEINAGEAARRSIELGAQLRLDKPPLP